MTTYRKQRYDVALNGQGYILATKPETPKITASQDSIYNFRYAQGDRTYNDFSKFWYMVQTDWSGGFKDFLSWLDDAKHYFSTNIDAYSEPGALKLHKAPTLHNDFAQNLKCGTEGTVNSNFRKYVGTDAKNIYEYSSSWSDISTAVFDGTKTTSISQLLTRQNYLWAFNSSPLTTPPYTYLVARYLSSWVDCTADISDATVLNWNVVTAHAGVEIGTTLYVAVSGNANQIAIVKTAVAAPALPASWSVVFNRTQAGKIVDIAEYLGDLYYLINYSNTQYELRKYIIASSADSSVGKITTPSAGSPPTTGVGGRLLLVQNGKLNVLLPKAWWQWNNSTLTRIWKWDNDKNNVDVDANGDSLYGGIVSDNKILSGNLVYDGTYFYNWIKKDGDAANGRLITIFNDSSDTPYFYDDTDTSKLWYIGTGYKGTADKNYLVFNNYDKISGIDKLAISVTINFRALVSGQTIKVEYFTGELSSSSTLTSLGSASFTADGGSVLTKTLYFGDAVTFKKIWFRVKLEGGGSNTPTLTDFILAYLPIPDYKLKWKFTVKCQDEIQRKDDSKEPKTGLWLRNLLREAWWTKSVLSFEDYDAMAGELVSGSLSATATTITVKNTTDNFPERGRILIESEEILYNGKNKTQFLNCVRGSRGTIAATHADGATVSTAYRVLINNYEEQLIIANEPTKAEYLVTIQLAEV